MNTYSTGPTGRRRQAILQVVRSGAVRSQEELQGRLRRQGIVVAQPTLSRDVKALGLAKTAAGYRLPDGAPPAHEPATAAATLDRTVRELALDVRAAGSLVVVRTPPAAASTMARALDEAGLPGLVGTVAGDDTVFIATPGVQTAERLERRLSAPLGPLRARLRARG
jgi:transcriptional regulator of arginine metabolism